MANGRASPPCCRSLPAAGPRGTSAVSWTGCCGSATQERVGGACRRSTGAGRLCTLATAAGAPPAPGSASATSSPGASQKCRCSTNTTSPLLLAVRIRGPVPAAGQVWDVEEEAHGNVGSSSGYGHSWRRSATWRDGGGHRCTCGGCSLLGSARASSRWRRAPHRVNTSNSIISLPPPPGRRHRWSGCWRSTRSTSSAAPVRCSSWTTPRC